MKIKLHSFSLILAVLAAGFGASAQGADKILVLDFNCSGIAAGKSQAIGDSLRAWVVKDGGAVVPREQVTRLLSQEGLKESDLNTRIEDLKPILSSLGVRGAVGGQVVTKDGLLTTEFAYLPADSGVAIYFDPIIASTMKDLYSTIPDMARIIVSRDKFPPRLVSVEPADGSAGVGQYVEIRIEFSEPMNPLTYSLSGKPEGMWSRYGDVVYDSTSDTFIFKVHLYPDIKYEFHINGENSKGFKDVAGNPAPKYVWSFSTAR